jgi:hypothetical protein
MHGRVTNVTAKRQVHTDRVEGKRFIVILLVLEGPRGTGWQTDPFSETRPVTRATRLQLGLFYDLILTRPEM